MRPRPRLPRFGDTFGEGMVQAFLAFVLIEVALVVVSVVTLSFDGPAAYSEGLAMAWALLCFFPQLVFVPLLVPRAWRQGHRKRAAGVLAFGGLLLVLLVGYGSLLGGS